MIFMGFFVYNFYLIWSILWSKDIILFTMQIMRVIFLFI